MNLQEDIERIKEVMGIYKPTFVIFEDRLQGEVLYHGNRKGDFPPKIKRFAGAIFLTSNIDFAKQFAEIEEFPDAKIFEVQLKEGINLCDPSNPEVMRDLDLKSVLQNMIDNKYVDEVTGMKFNEVGAGFKGYDYDKDEEFDIKDKSESVYFYLWRIRNGSWRIIECEPIINQIKNSKYDGFYVIERGSKNVAIFDENNIQNFKPID